MKIGIHKTQPVVRSLSSQPDGLYVNKSSGVIVLKFSSVCYHITETTVMSFPTEKLNDIYEPVKTLDITV